ncbi:MAG TPA: class I SAM-dependent methyltransferase [Solirubrobacteraceae bacterium]|nr:class I SAM-dependent methyltransferase [Solirubrobacteraceae bacterium]
MAGSEQRQDWEDLSVLDPYWAILSERAGRFGRWDREAFLARGEQEIDAVLNAGMRLGLPRERDDALDFGCGAGRLTLAMSCHFRRCLGLDISERMVEQARELGTGIANCDFAVHDASDLAALQSASFDLVVSRLVLQHIPSAETKARYIAEFVRVLRPGGLVAFQLPSRIPVRHRMQPRPRLYGVLRRAGVPPRRLYRQLRLHPIRMSALARSRVLESIEGAGGQPLDVREQTVAGGVISCDYLATKA